MINWLLSLVCNHDWSYIFSWENTIHRFTMFGCNKCGKIHKEKEWKYK